MTPILRDMVPHLLRHLESVEGRRLIAIAGAPGSGKSTLAATLADEVNRCTAPNTLVALGMDGFHLTKHELSQQPDPDEAFARRGAPWTFNTVAMYERMLQVQEAAGRSDVPWPGFEHNIGDPVEGAYVVPASTRLVIIEGLYLLHQADGWDAISRLFDERWFLDTPMELSLERLALRHMQAWDWSREQAEARIATSDRFNAELVQETAQFADWRVVS